MPLRLLDANVFIQAKNVYYSFDLVPAFWTWIRAQATLGTLASTDMVYQELRDGGDDLAVWVRANRQDIFHVDSSSPVVAHHVNSLYSWAQRKGYRQHAIKAFLDGADPFLVGVAAKRGSIVVTQETPAGESRRKVKIPDACNHLGVQYENTFEMMRSLRARFA